MKAVRLFCLLALLPLCSAAQNFTLTGRVLDTMNRITLGKASLTLLQAKDSILVDYGRAAADGTFTLQADSAGDYLLLVSFPSFAEYVEHVTVQEKKTDMKDIAMITRSRLLSEFVLKQARGAIKIKGDTIEYMADSFLVREGANVEELLKKLPGLQVSKNGEVTAQGEKVSKILVDGEEFFSDDPAVVTRSLQSKTVEKVQVYDKKSDAAIFSGIDDGIKEKTINLTLKEDMKKGFFGKVQAGGGTDGFYENQGMINSFRGKRQLSAFGVLSNTPNVGLGWEDRDKYTGGGGAVMSTNEDGAIISTWTSSDDDDDSWDGRYNGEGLPQVATGGVHYANRWGGDKHHVSGNYRYAKQELEVLGNTLSQYILPDSSYTSDQRKTSYSRNERHRGDGLYEWKLDTTSNIRLTANAGTINSQTTTNYNTVSKSASDVLLNTSLRITDADVETGTHNLSLQYRKRLRKKGRTISANVDESSRSTTSNSTLFADNAFYVGGGLFHDTTDQLKRNNSNRLNVNGGLTYTEPLSKTTFLELRYGLQLQDNDASRLSFNRVAPGDSYTVLDSAFSSDYDYNYFTNTGGTFLRIVLKKYRFSAGGSAAHTSFDQKDKFRDTTRHRTFNNFFPSASFTYKIGTQSDVSLSYNGATTQPSIEQIQPLRQNLDPLNIETGNPGLRQQFDHRFNLQYHDYKVISGTYTYVGGSFTLTQDDIARTEKIDQSGRREYSYINIDGNYSGYLYGGRGMKIQSLEGARLGVNTNLGITRNNTIINGIKNFSSNNSYGLSADLRYEKEKKFDLSLEPGFTYFQNTSSISTQAQSYWSTNTEVNANVELPWKMQTNFSVNWIMREKTDVFQRNNNVVLVNLWVSKKFLKNNQLELRATGYDLLNQNIGFQRYGSGNQITERSYNTIRRYGLLSVIWNFTHSPAGKPAEEAGGMRIKL